MRGKVLSSAILQGKRKLGPQGATTSDARKTEVKTGNTVCWGACGATGTHVLWRECKLIEPPWEAVSALLKVSGWPPDPALCSQACTRQWQIRVFTKGRNPNFHSGTIRRSLE